MAYESLLELNRSALFEKLDTVFSLSGSYVACDLIDILSNQPDRDKRLINDWNNGEVVVHKIVRDGGLRSVRFFTKAGICRYLIEGKLFAYADACSYFNEPVVNLEHLKWTRELAAMEVKEVKEVREKDREKEDKTYKTTSLLKWLFGKRKMCVELGKSTTIPIVIDKFSEDPDIIEERLKFLKEKTKNTN
jgi:hypothetical protein